MRSATSYSAPSAGRSRRPCATWTSRPASAAKSSWSCSATPARRWRLRSGSGSGVPWSGSTFATSASVRSPSRSERQFRARTARPSPRWWSEPTMPCTAPSATAATGSRRRRPRAAGGRRPRIAEDGAGVGPATGTILGMAVDERAEVPLPANEVPLPTNGDLSRVFHEIGDLLEIKGELVFKTVAYHRAADAIAHSPVEIARAYRAGTQPRIPGAGKAISDKIAELATTGRLAFLDRLHAAAPGTLVEVLAIPGLGPKTVKLLWEGLGITTLDGLRTALDSGALRDAKGITEKGEQAIRVGLDALERRGVRMTLGDADRIVESIVELLRDTPGLVALTPAGSFRRRRETIGDLDLLAETDDPLGVAQRHPDASPLQRVEPH